MSSEGLQKSEPFYMQIKKNIKEKIIMGELKPDDRILETEIAKLYGTSRSPVREAIMSLLNEGLLVLNGSSRITVYKPTVKDIEDIYQCRTVLEVFALETAMVKLTIDDFSKLKLILKQADFYLENNNLSAYVKYNAKFHRYFINVCDNVKLASILDNLSTLTNYYRFINASSIERSVKIQKEHWKIFELIQSGQYEVAISYYKKHLENDMQNLVESINKHETEANDEKI